MTPPVKDKTPLEIAVRGGCGLTGTMGGCEYPGCPCSLHPDSIKRAFAALSAAGYVITKNDRPPVKDDWGYEDGGCG